MKTSSLFVCLLLAGCANTDATSNPSRPLGGSTVRDAGQSEATCSLCSGSGGDAEAGPGNGVDSGAPTGPDSGPGTNTGPCAGSPFFCDAFTDSALATDYATDNGVWTRAKGSYTVTDANEWERARSTLAYQESNFDLTLEGHTEGDSGFGILYGASAGASDGYAVLVHPAQFQSIYLKHFVPGAPEVDVAVAPLPAGLAGTAMTLRVQRQGTQVTVWLNGTQMLQSSDGAPTLQGRMGLLLSATDDTTGGGAAFTLFRIDSASPLNSDGGAPLEAGAPDAQSTGDAGTPDSGSATGVMAQGLYMGNVASNNDVFANLAGRVVNVMSSYVDSRDTSPILFQPAASGGSGATEWLKADPTRRLVMGVNPLMGEPGNWGSAALDGQMAALAKYVVSFGIASQVIVRFGYEMNGTWMPWGNEYDNATGDGFRSMWIREHGIVNAIYPFKWDWCAVFWDSGAPSVSFDYPGDAYVDSIGSDNYDDWATGTPQQRWAAIEPRLQGQADFAAAHGKPASQDEYAMWSTSNAEGGGDDPYYITNFLQFCAQNHYAWVTYFDVTDGDVDTTLDQNPNGLTAYRTFWSTH